MKCSNCDYQSDEKFAFCPNCGTEQPKETVEEAPKVNNYTENGEEVAVNPVAERVRLCLNDSLFLVICILQTVSVGIHIIQENFNIIGVLLTVFLWIFYCKGKKIVTDGSDLRRISGTVFASYVVNWVVAGLLAFCGFLLFMAFSLIGSDRLDYLISEIQDEFNKLNLNLNFDISRYIGNFVASFAWFIAVVIILIAAVFALINLFGTRSIHLFVQSAYRSIDNASFNMVKVRAAINWLIVFGIFAGISAFSSIKNIQGFLASGCSCAALILLSIVVKKYFSDCEQNNQQ